MHSDEASLLLLLSDEASSVIRVYDANAANTEPLHTGHHHQLYNLSCACVLSAYHVYVTVQLTGWLWWAVELHSAPVVLISVNPAAPVAISVDKKGLMHYWSTKDFTMPKDEISFKMYSSVSAAQSASPLLAYSLAVTARFEPRLLFVFSYDALLQSVRSLWEPLLHHS